MMREVKLVNSSDSQQGGNNINTYVKVGQSTENQHRDNNMDTNVKVLQATEDQQGDTNMNTELDLPQPSDNQSKTGDMNTGVTFLRAVSERIGGHLVIYWRCRHGNIHKLEPMKLIEHIRSTMDCNLNTYGYLNGDPLAEPCPTIISWTERIAAYFSRRESDVVYEKMVQDYSSDLEEEYMRLNDCVQKLEALELAHQAGILNSDGKEFYSLFAEFGHELGMR